MDKIAKLDRLPCDYPILYVEYEKDGETLKTFGVYHGYNRSSSLILDTPKNGRQWIQIGDCKVVKVVDPIKLVLWLAGREGTMLIDNLFKPLWETVPVSA